MCGIAVCVKNNGIIDRNKFDRMIDVVKHRGPDDRGTYYDKGLALGHRRLAIIDTSTEGHQPFVKVDGYVLVFNGEIYNYIELRKELEQKGHVFTTETDTEVLVHAYSEWGKKCVSHFNGMWAFVIYDKNNGVLFCSRDRYGVKPLYYTEQEGMILIASEIKQFFEILEHPPKANKPLLLQYIIRGIIEVPPETLFKDIYQLEPGHNMLINLYDGSSVKEKYYDIGWNNKKSTNYKDACALFYDLLTNSVRLRLRADVPLGYFLSGGLDSSSIVCVANGIVKENEKRSLYKEQHTVSSCFHEKEYDEQEYIDEIIRVTDIIPHKIFPSEKNMLEELDKLIWHMDEPVSGSTGFAQWSVCKAAKDNGLTVMLDGQGADEQLAGYNDFYRVLFIYSLKKKGCRYLKKEIDAYLNLKVPNWNRKTRFFIMLSTIKDCLVPPHFDRFIKMIYIKHLARLPFDRKVICDVVNGEYLYPRRDPDAFIKAYMENELLYQLHQGDRYSMAHSLECRNPFLDYRLVDSIYEMPFEYKIKDGYTKAVLRDALDGVLPEKVRRRVSKFGFETPGDKWFAENSDYYRNEFKKSLLKFSSLFETDRIMTWYDKVGNTRERNALMWRIIDSARWMDIFKVSLD